MTTQDKIDAYLNKHEKWQESILLLSELVQTIGLEETVKWGMPTYTHKGKNVVGIGAFKTHISLC